VGVFGLLFTGGLGGSPLVLAFAGKGGGTRLALPISGSLNVHLSGETIDTLMYFRYISFGVVTLNVLPSMTVLTKDGVAIVFTEATKAFDDTIIVCGWVGNHQMSVG